MKRFLTGHIFVSCLQQMDRQTIYGFAGVIPNSAGHVSGGNQFEMNAFQRLSCCNIKRVLSVLLPGVTVRHSFDSVPTGRVKIADNEFSGLRTCCLLVTPPLYRYPSFRNWLASSRTDAAAPNGPFLRRLL